MKKELYFVKTFLLISLFLFFACSNQQTDLNSYFASFIKREKESIPDKKEIDGENKSENQQSSLLNLDFYFKIETREKSEELSSEIYNNQIKNKEEAVKIFEQIELAQNSSISLFKIKDREKDLQIYDLPDKIESISLYLDSTLVKMEAGINQLILKNLPENQIYTLVITFNAYGLTQEAKFYIKIKNS